MQAEIVGEGENRKLVITLPLQVPTPSGSGKNLTVASSYGCRVTNAIVDGRQVTVGVNAFIPLKKQA